MIVDAGQRAAKVDLDSGEPRRPDKKWKLTLLGLVGIFVVLACYDLISVSGQYGWNSVTSASGTATPARGQAGALSSPGSASRRTPGKASSPAPHPLDVTSAAAFGPEGRSDGDNPGIVSRVLDVRPSQPWYSQWYTTPEFGELRSGTGILLDMGKTVTVADVRLVLGTAPGANVQLRAGNAPSLADLPSVASARDVSGTVRLAATAPAKGRYVLIWFTRLPPDLAGHYQISVYRAVVDGSKPAANSG